MYHSGLLFKTSEGDASAQNRTARSGPNKNGPRPPVGNDNKTHVESFDTGFGLMIDNYTFIITALN